MNTPAMGLPLGLRLRRALLVALILGAWAPLKIVWEQQLAHEQDYLRYRGVTLTRHLRDELGQGLTIGILSGMRSVVADFVWLNVTVAWQTQQWFKMESYINLCTALQPRSITFWDVGGWQLAWNASVAAMQDLRQPNPLRRIKASRFWIDRGLTVYLRGIENNPQSYKLWAQTGLLYQQRLAENERRMGQNEDALRDYRKAAYYYGQASQQPDCPIFYERFPAIMYGLGGDERASYDAWRALWERLTPAQREQMEHKPTPKDLERIRQLEMKLSIPSQKRIFPN